MNDQQLATHEAGHVVVAAFLTTAVDAHVRADGGRTNWDRCDARRTAAISLAGAVANMLAVAPERTFLSVMTHVRSLLSDAERVPGAILSKSDGEIADDHFHYAVATAYTILRQFATLHAAVAERLATTGKLGEDDVRRLLDEHGVASWRLEESESRTRVIIE